MTPTFFQHLPQQALVVYTTSVFLFFLSSATGLGQSTEDPLLKRPRTESLLKDHVNSDAEPQADDATIGFGIPYSRVMRDVEPPYEDIFRNFKMEGEIDTKLGEGAAEFHADFFRGVNLNTPFEKGIRPETSELKLGNFYIDIKSLAAKVLVSDNVNQSEDNRKADVLMALQLDLAAAYQFGENFRLTLRGSVIYYPLSGKVGVIDNTFWGLGFQPLASARMSYDLHLSHWEIELINDFVLRHQRFGKGADFEIFEGATFEHQERSGHYRVGRGERNVGTGPDDLGTDFVEARNRAGVIVTRMLPTETRFEAGAFHENRFYFNEDKHDLPNTREQLFANLINEREEMRFNPFLHYQASKLENQDDWTHQLRGGIRGPVTDYVEFLGDVGQYWASTGLSRRLWRLRLTHNPTPLLYYQLQFSRTVTEPDEDLDDAISFRLRYKMKENLRAEAIAIKSHFKDVDGNQSGSDEWRAGIRFTYDFARGLSAQLGEVYSRIEHDDARSGDHEIWTTRLEVRCQHTDTLDSRLAYIMRIDDSSLAGDSFYEHLLIYTLTKYF